MLCEKLQPLLIVEDSDTDFLLLAKILKQVGITYPIHHAPNGNEALDFLYRQGSYQQLSKTPFPVAILLDLNLPGMGGKECLKIIKQDQMLKMIPIIILSSSDDPTDINYCYQYGANSYMLKTTVLTDYKKTIEVLVNWLEVSVFPTL
ncbi:MAG: response regulator [Xenococcaceae cyanobacterium MO_207.B15]|nr:response regulator [Xenococcaceae cyanobacterium MO_207.B15]